jgi:LysR family glycine cleavage system transcriptional activator
VQAAVDGHGVCIGRRAYVEDDLRAGRLVAPFSKAVTTDRAFYLVSPPDLANCPKVVALRTWLIDIIGNTENQAAKVTSAPKRTIFDGSVGSGQMRPV